MTQVLEAVPNFSEGRDPTVVRALVDAIAARDVEVLDWSADPDHHRCVVTYIGAPADVEAAAVDAADVALRRIDLRAHRGVHPRIGALDVLPFVPLVGLGMDDAVDSARRAGAAIAELGVPIFFYGAASDPPGRGLAGLRKGGFEGMADGFAPGLVADLPPGTDRPHPTAGATCVGAREVLLAWNVFVTGLELDDVEEIAGRIRERGGGFRGLRALGLHLPDQDRLQVSMNLEDPVRTAPLRVFEAIESEVVSRGGKIVGTQVIGMMPDTLVLPGVADRLQLLDPGAARVLSRRVARYVESRHDGRMETSDITE